MPDLFSSIVRASGARIYGLLATFGILVVTARSLGPEGRGQLAAVTTWMTLIGTFGSLSLGQVAIHRAAENREGNWLDEVLPALLMLAAVITVISVGVVAILDVRGVFGDVDRSLVALAFLIVPFFLWEQYGTSLLSAMNRLDIYNRRQVVGRTASLAVVVVAAWLGWGVTGALAGVVLGQVVVGTSGLRFLARAAGTLRVRGAAVFALLRGGAQLHLNAIGSFLVLSTQILIINYYRGAAETGYFQAASQLVSTVLVVPQAAAVVLYGLVAREGADGAWPEQRRTLLRLMLLISVLAALAAAVAPLAIPLALGNDFGPAVRPFRILLVAVVGMTFSILMAPQWIGRGMFIHASVLTLTLGLMNLAIGMIWVPGHGMNAAVLGTVVTYLVAIATNGAMMIHCDRRVALAAAEASR